MQTRAHILYVFFLFVSLGLARLVPYLSPPAGFYALYRRRGHEGTI